MFVMLILYLDISHIICFIYTVIYEQPFMSIYRYLLTAPSGILTPGSTCTALRLITYPCH